MHQRLQRRSSSGAPGPFPSQTPVNNVSRLPPLPPPPPPAPQRPLLAAPARGNIGPSWLATAPPPLVAQPPSPATTLRNSSDVFGTDPPQARRNPRSFSSDRSSLGASAAGFEAHRHPTSNADRSDDDDPGTTYSRRSSDESWREDHPPVGSASISQAAGELMLQFDLGSREYLPCKFIVEGTLSADGVPSLNDGKELNLRPHDFRDAPMFYWESDCEDDSAEAGSHANSRRLLTHRHATFRRGFSNAAVMDDYSDSDSTEETGGDITEDDDFEEEHDSLTIDQAEVDSPTLLSFDEPPFHFGQEPQSANSLFRASGELSPLPRVRLSNGQYVNSAVAFIDKNLYIQTGTGVFRAASFNDVSQLRQVEVSAGHSSTRPRIMETIVRSEIRREGSAGHVDRQATLTRRWSSGNFRQLQGSGLIIQSFSPGESSAPFAANFSISGNAVGAVEGGAENMDRELDHEGYDDGALPINDSVNNPQNTHECDAEVLELGASAHSASLTRLDEDTESGDDDEWLASDEQTTAILEWTRQARVRRVLIAPPKQPEHSGLAGQGQDSALRVAAMFSPNSLRRDQGLHFNGVDSAEPASYKVETEEIPLMRWLMTRNLLDFDGNVWKPRDGEGTRTRRVHPRASGRGRPLQTDRESYRPRRPRRIGSLGPRESRRVSVDAESTGEDTEDEAGSEDDDDDDEATSGLEDEDEEGGYGWEVQDASDGGEDVDDFDLTNAEGSASYSTSTAQQTRPPQRAPCGLDVPGGGTDLLRLGLDADGNCFGGERGGVGGGGGGEEEEERSPPDVIVVVERMANGGTLGCEGQMMGMTEVLAVAFAPGGKWVVGDGVGR